MDRNGVWYGEVEVIRETDRALLVDYEGEEVWIAKSMIHDDSEIWGKHDPGDRGRLALPYWLAKEKGLTE